MDVMYVTRENFETDVMGSDVPVLVDFWAPWCGPCKMLGPIVDEIAREADGFKVAKINVDDEPSLATKFGIQSIPTLMVIDSGEVKERHVGTATKEQILSLLK